MTATDLTAHHSEKHAVESTESPNAPEVSCEQKSGHHWKQRQNMKLTGTIVRQLETSLSAEQNEQSPDRTIESKPSTNNMKCEIPEGLINPLVCADLRHSFECYACGKLFMNNQALRNHSYVHTGEKPYSCPECFKRFRDRSNLKRHSRLHSGVKSYVCEVCGKMFSQSSNLNTHRSTHGMFSMPRK
jgi:uncharacterized Zn-finger protein